jgi:hypothetical protein
MIAYARAGVGRPPGAITPDEARQAVYRSSDSHALGDQAAALMELCDKALFAAGPQECDGFELHGLARGLFLALAQVSKEASINEPPARASE